MKQALQPFGQARSDFTLLSGIAGELGLEAAFTEGLDEMGWIRRLYDEGRAVANNHARGFMRAVLEGRPAARR